MIGVLAVIVLVLLAAEGCSSVSICLEQNKGVSASDDVKAGNQACTPNQPPR
jgi:hypothetical protein